MESIGEKLRLARERDNLTIEQVARDTHVARRFLKALEDEDFTVFPGETYAMGFLRSYAEYLGLDAEELIALYRNLKIQEQPLPMSELLETRRTRPSPLILVAALAAILVLAGAGYLIYRAAAQGGAKSAAMKGQAGRREEFVFQDEVRTKWFALGDAISVPADGKTWRIEVGGVSDTLTLKVPGGTVELGLGKERFLDLDGDSKPELKVVWNDVDRTSTPKRVNLGLYRTSGPGGSLGESGSSESLGKDIPATVANPPVRTGGAKPVALAKAAESALFKLDFTFRGDCLFRFLADDRDREDRFFQKGEMFSLDAKRQITLWLSNAGAARMRIEGRDFELGGLGEVATRKIAWRKDAAAGGYVLEIAPLY
jgi:cytoskeletal protein RodZ